MANPSSDVMEMVLRECESANGRPWYPSEYARATGIDRDMLDASVDRLRMGGLIQITEWVQGKGQGYVLTDVGREVTASPRLLNRLRNQGFDPDVAPKPKEEPAVVEQRPAGWDRAKMLQDVLLTPQTPVVTRILFGVNVFVFLAGMMLVISRGESVSAYVGMKTNAKIMEIRHETGALNLPDDIKRGEWWRLLTCNFVHHGLLHIGMNMYALFILGPFLEQIWGRGRYLLLYLVTGISMGMVATLLHNGQAPTMLAGASGAICGLLGAIIPWVLLNKAYLPPAFSSQMMRNMFINIILITVISMLPGVSWEGHLGGGIAGAVLAVPLNYSRYGQGSQRWLGWLGVVILPLAFFGYFAYKVGPTELERVRLTYTDAIVNADHAAVDFMKKQGKEFLNHLTNNGKVSQDEVKKTFAQIADVEKEIGSAQKLLNDAPTYTDPRINQALNAARKYLANWDKYFQTMKRTVDENGNIVHGEMRTLESLYNRKQELFPQVQESILFKLKE